MARDNYSAVLLKILFWYLKNMNKLRHTSVWPKLSWWKCIVVNQVQGSVCATCLTEDLKEVVCTAAYVHARGGPRRVSRCTSLSGFGGHFDVEFFWRQQSTDRRLRQISLNSKWEELTLFAFFNLQGKKCRGFCYLFTLVKGKIHLAI